MDDLRDRVKDKESTIERKARISQELQTDKRRMETEVAELKDQLESFERKNASLQKKVGDATLFYDLYPQNKVTRKVAMIMFCRVIKLAFKLIKIWAMQKLMIL